VDNEARNTDESLEQRVASLEAAVRALSAELLRLQSRPDVPRVGDAAMPPIAAPPGRRSAWSRQVDLESLVGRYGTLVLATISGLAAVGTFLCCAIAKGMLGPSQRIALGLLVASGLAVGGLRLRRRERSFGASLLGLALAVTHVCAWGAGPSLHLVPDWVAFVLAAIASIALAIFAHAEADEPLWSVGFSGAAIAPFVTSTGKGNLALLTAYGVAVLATSGYAMGARRWMVAGRLFLLAAALYTAVLATGFEKDFGPLLAMAFPLLVAITGVFPWIGGWDRRERLRALGALAAAAAVRSALGVHLPLEKRTIATLIGLAGVVWLVLVDRSHDVPEDAPSTMRYLHEGDWLDTGVLPLAFAVAAVMALDASARVSGMTMGASAVVLIVAVTRFPQGSLRDAAVFGTVMSALIALLLVEKGHPLTITGSVAVLGALCFAANVAWRSLSWTVLGLLGLGWSALATIGHLTDRVPYQDTPFATRPTLVAAIVLVSVASAWRLSRSERRLEMPLRSGIVGWAFVWVHQEIAFAFSATAATLLRVTYYAATSVTAVWVGRVRALPLLRHIGLALAVLAAGTALYGARKLDAIAARIAADLVAAVFLLAIAYWYRRPGAGRLEAGAGRL